MYVQYIIVWKKCIEINYEQLLYNKTERNISRDMGHANVRVGIHVKWDFCFFLTFTRNKLNHLIKAFS